MLKFLSRLFQLPCEPGDEPEAASTDTVQRIVRELTALPVDQARYVAAFAFVLGRVAMADNAFSDHEFAQMIAIVERTAGLPRSTAELVASIAREQQLLFGTTENFLVTKEFEDIASPEQKLALLHCLFEVAAADGVVSLAEEQEIRQIANSLHLSHGDFIRARLMVDDKREV